MTALTVPTLVLAGPFDPSVSVLPLGDKQAMVPCECLSRPTPYSNIGPDHDGSPDECPDCYMGERSFVSGPIHIAHQCPECEGEGRAWLPNHAWIEPCRTCGGIVRQGDLYGGVRGSGWVVRSAQAEQVRQCKLPNSTTEWQRCDYATCRQPERFVLLLPGVSSETSPYLGDVTAGWRS